VIRKLRISSLVLFALLSSAAEAQTAGPDEAMGARGDVAQKLWLTPAQRNAIYNAVMRQKVPTSSRGIRAVIGAPVPPSVLLSDLPGSGVGDGIGAGVLKYATVEGDVVVIDPIRMRVVDVIHGEMAP